MRRHFLTFPPDDEAAGGWVALRNLRGGDEEAIGGTRQAMRRSDDNFAAWADFKAWMDVAFARALRMGTDAVHEADPTALAWLDAGGRGTHRTALLSPFDSLIWDRKRTLRMFGFEHTLEAYVPQPKRVHCYYTMPLLARGRLLGRRNRGSRADRDNTAENRKLHHGLLLTGHVRLKADDNREQTLDQTGLRTQLS